jgi:hypothetical protein
MTFLCELQKRRPADAQKMPVAFFPYSQWPVGLIFFSIRALESVAKAVGLETVALPTIEKKRL